MQQTQLLSGRQVPLTGRLSLRKLPIRLGSTKHRVSAMLVPADVAPQRGKSKESTRSHQPGQSRGLAGVLLSALRVWERQEQQKIPAEELLTQAAVRSDQVCWAKESVWKCLLVCILVAV
jgi:endonuclease I